jgi:large subunit ribosomal protein L22
MAVEARAQKRSIQSSPRKMRIVLDMIRGKRVPEALSILHFTPNHASVIAEKTLRSAIANFQQKPEHSRFDIEDLYVRQCFADGGASLKRVLPAPMGRAFRVRKRSNHLTIIVGDQPTANMVSKRAKQAAAKALQAPTGVKGAPKASTKGAAAGAKDAAPKKSRAKKTATAAA